MFSFLNSLYSSFVHSLSLALLCSLLELDVNFFSTTNSGWELKILNIIFLSLFSYIPIIFKKKSSLFLKGFRSKTFSAIQSDFSKTFPKVPKKSDLLRLFIFYIVIILILIS